MGDSKKVHLTVTWRQKRHLRLVALGGHVWTVGGWNGDSKKERMGWPDSFPGFLLKPAAGEESMAQLPPWSLEVTLYPRLHIQPFQGRAQSCVRCRYV